MRNITVIAHTAVEKIKFKDMQVDHMKPQRSGGDDELDNLIPSCRTCNHYKRANNLEAFRDMISKIPCKLERDSYIYRVGMAYGLYDSYCKDVKFYFERIESTKAGEQKMRTTEKLVEDLESGLRIYREGGTVSYKFQKGIENAIDAIKELSEKLHNSQMERSSMYHNGGWIPCNERLPAQGENIILTYRDSFQDKVCVYPAWRCNIDKTKPDGQWAIEGRLRGYVQDIKCGIAWMPLPNPYIERGET